MFLSDAGLKPYTDTAYHNEELKSLTRYRFDKVKKRAQLKKPIPKLVCILFPELEKLVLTLYSASVYSLLNEFPRAKQIAEAHPTNLKALLVGASRGRYGQDMALKIPDTAKCPIRTISSVAVGWNLVMLVIHGTLVVFSKIQCTQ